MTVPYDLMPPAERDGKHQCQRCGHLHVDNYAGLCEAERRRLHPQHFERWPEDEHARHATRLTYAQQERVWLELDVWEAVFKGEGTVEDARAYLGQLEPLPAINERIEQALSVLARSKMPHQVPMTTPNFNESQWKAMKAQVTETGQ